MEVPHVKNVMNINIKIKKNTSKQSDTEPPATIALFMAYPKADKLEVVTQKAVELGASRIIPFESSRCIKRPKAEKAEKSLW